MKQWWQSLNKREQNLVTAAAVLVAIAVLYWGIWSPIAGANAQAKQRLASQQQTLEWAQQQGSVIIANGRPQQTSSEVKVSQAVSSSARQQRITISRIQPKGDEVEVWIESVPFNQLMTWLKMLSQRYGIIVENVDLDEGKQEGIVGVRRLRLGKAE
ncbi:type II secretion system protein M [Agarivorans sp. OAG1]|uniref:type II secretion system protein GspM n=1 Tax=Agarivorans TaxID=261825 RepID=UPI00128C83B7|nr:MULTISPECIES: type II secretion system protein M [Agarivorans]MPW30169.1 type II secretion system protein M [Agarivorans sp. B2Z047]UQN43200.1 type II secretion system protein M [Agarivorans sp. B2Z047]BEU01510.1 type II secretion system protein M [Agarivorans sp. OAG1]